MCCPADYEYPHVMKGTTFVLKYASLEEKEKRRSEVLPAQSKISETGRSKCGLKFLNGKCDLQWEISLSIYRVKKYLMNHE